MSSNRTLADQLTDALVEAAEAKSFAFKLERKYKRVLRACTLACDAKSWAEREARGAETIDARAAEDAWVQAEQDSNIARAKAQGLEYQFEQYRTERATERAQMNLR